MKTILLGNAGSGKSTLARKLAAREAAAWLSLDDLAFAEGTARRPLRESLAEALRFTARHERWVVEGCYGDLVEGLLPYCDELILLNPGVEACIERCRRRPWEPGKFASREEQDRHLPQLIEWVACYETRQDEYGLTRHRALFDAFQGPKTELTATDPDP